MFFSGISLADSNSSDISVSITPNLALSIVDNNGVENLVALDITPSAIGAFASTSTNVIASTTNETGYTITMSDTDDNTAMQHTDSTITTTIPTLSSASDEASFPTNYYGYNFNNTTDPSNPSATELFYSPIPALSTPTTLITTTTNGNATYPFTIATKLDTTIPAGTYKDTIVFSITANYVPQIFNGITTMQEMTPAICSAATIGDTATLTDTRDSKTYTIAKLADGNCWMTQNLRLGGATDMVLTSDSSNLADNTTYTLPASAGGNWEDNDISHMLDDYANNWLDDNNALQTSGTPSSDSRYIGNYYNWYAATAGTGQYSMSSGNTSYSICPKGWKLPTGDPNGDFQELHAAYGNDPNSLISAAKLILTGIYHPSRRRIEDIGVHGEWLSSTPSISSYSYVYHLYYAAPSTISPAKQEMYKVTGASVRCVAEQENLTTISTMQQMTTDICAATPTPAASATVVPENTITDTRDGNTYVVRKLADGNCWMAQNLRLGKVGEDLTLAPNDSDVSVNTAIPVSQIHNTSANWNQNDAYHIYDRSTDVANGNLYSWHAATAGTGTAAMINQDAPNSVCPKGWKLPEGSGASSFRNLITTYGATTLAKIQATPLDFTANGAYHYVNHRIEATTEIGHYWSSSATTNAVQTYALTFHAGGVNQQYGYDKPYGFAVRCVAR